MSRVNSAIPGVIEVPVTKAEFISEIQKMAKANMRFATATCLNRGDKMEVVYTFENDDLVMTNVRLKVDKGEKIPSISQIYLCALLIENEMRDQFGVEITGIAIDYQSRMLLTEDSPQVPLQRLECECAKPAPQKKGRCAEACLAGINVPKYVRLIADGRYSEALKVVYRNNPLPAICGRVCFAPCEINCRQSLQGDPVMIRLLKRFIADKVGLGVPKSNAPGTGKKIAIIGAGPAGLVAGYYLARKGHSPTIFDSLPEAGGMMRVGIPEYRLPRNVLAQEIDIIKQQGVEIKLNTKINTTDELFKQGFQAVLVATGAHKNSEMGVTGETCEGVHNCVSFLREANLGRKVKVGDKVLVVGGGNAAIDAARVAKRLGAREVVMLYRRTQKEMPASEKERHEAIEEGIKIEELCAPQKIENVGGKVKITCIRMKLGAPDASGRPRPEPITGSEFAIEADSIIAAIGQTCELPPEMGLKLSKKGRIEAIDKPGVFAAGDLLTGPTSVVEAIKTGREAAESIDKFLGGNGVMMEPENALGSEFVPRMPMDDKLKNEKQAANPCMKPEQRCDNFKEVELGVPEDAARKEASRCWRCDWTEF
jgi:formate dehydrogenase beta subunit